MRIVRFRDDDGQVHLGRVAEDGEAVLLRDPIGVLGPASASVATPRDLFRGRTALVADDDEKMCEFMAATLTRAGCACTVCTDGPEAVSVLEREPVDLVVSDIILPHLSGYEIFEAAKRQRENLPVVLVTGFGYDPTHTLVRASRNGLTTILYKPFTPQELLEEVDRAIRINTSSPIDALVPTEARLSVGPLTAPLKPTCIVCIGRNYRDPGAHVDPPTWDQLEVFLKPPGSVIGPGEPIRIPDMGGVDPLVDCEGELAIVIGMTARNLAPENALDCVLGYTIANDVTARHWQTKAGSPIWMRGKGFDTFCPIGPAIVTADEISESDDLPIRTIINGKTVRSATTGAMLRSARTILCDLSRMMTLEPGTIVLTGAPPRLESGQAAPLVAGDEVTIEIEPIGRLTNHVE